MSTFKRFAADRPHSKRLRPERSIVLDPTTAAALAQQRREGTHRRALRAAASGRLVHHGSGRLAD